MRRFIAFLSAVVLVDVGAHGANAAAAGPPINVWKADNGSAIAFQNSGGDSGGSGAPESVGIRPASTASPVRYPVPIPQLVSSPTGACVVTTVIYVSTPQDQASLTAANALRMPQFTPQWPLCQGAPAGPAAPAPAAIAAQFWNSQGENPLMKPAPRIRPGYAVTGKTAYLETGGTVAQAFNDPTGAGPLQIQASGQFWVDWGDGTPLAGPYDSTGAPYPDGTITHVWADTGSYVVTVYEKWTARWSLAGQTGTLGGLRTVGRIPAFPVKELVSVRNR